LYYIKPQIKQKIEERGHKAIPSASLIPENDPSLLFTTAGMHPLVPYLLKGKHPQGQRLVNFQKCLRTDDIEEIGDTYHHTFFEMLGNWSIGDPDSKDGIGKNGYWKKESIEWSYEFLTSKNWLGLDHEKIAVSVFEGDQDASFDEESYNIWKRLEIKEQKIIKLPKQHNWWGQVLGPCGPNTEIFYWSGDGEAPKKFNHEDERWLEIWNNVFMEYNRKIKEKDKNGKPIDFYFEPLKQKNVDTGMGLERINYLVNDHEDDYTSDLYFPIIQKIEELSGLKYGDKPDQYYVDKDEKCWVDTRKLMRIIADHLKAAVMAISDGALPSNKDAGYVVRRLIRRSIVKANELGIKENFTAKLASVVFGIYNRIYDFNKEMIIYELDKEEGKFRKTLQKGIKEFEKIIKVYTRWSHEKSKLKGNFLSGPIVFRLFATYGFPLELIKEMTKEKKIEIDENGFWQEYKRHQELSRTASKGKFKGGLADSSAKTVKLHTAAHLLLAALKRVLGENVEQKGSNINPERLRFDFSHPEKMTPEDIKKVEELVNKMIEKKAPVEMEEMSIEEAKKSGANGVFEEKYGGRVKVFTINNFSKEICGGPHVKNTSELGHFKIIKEESSSAGVRRIKATLE